MRADAETVGRWQEAVAGREGAGSTAVVVETVAEAQSRGDREEGVDRMKMPAFLLLCVTCLSSVICLAAGVSPTSAGETPLRLFVPDGQVKSHPLRVFVTRAIKEADLPRLDLYAPHTIDGEQLGGDHGWKPKLVAPGQQWTDVVDGQAVARDGTLLMFDLNKYPMPGWKPMARVTPVLRWGDALGTCVVVGSQDIYLGHLKVAMAWTAAMLVILTAAIGLAARRKTGHMRYLLCGPDHYFSPCGAYNSQRGHWLLAAWCSVSG